jgi:hypothetical protein
LFLLESDCNFYTSSSNLEEMASSYNQEWIDESSIEAPKVELKTTDGTERGLFATDTIYEGERLMFIPITALIGEDTLQLRGSKILEKNESMEDLSLADERTLEEWVIGMIEEFRELLQDQSSMLFVAAKQAQYEWRGDDAVALYLIACRHILQEHAEPAQSGTSSKQAEEVGSSVESESSLVDGQYPITVEAVAEDSVPEVTPFVEAVQEEGAPRDPIDRNDDFPEITVDRVIPEPVQDDSQNVKFSSFLPYVNMLPKSFPTSPLYFSAGELTRIEGTNCHGFATRMLHQIESDYSQLVQLLRVYNQMPNRKMRCQKCQDKMNETCWCHVLESEGVVELEGYKWALCNIYSRSTDFEWDTGDGQAYNRRVVAPLFDMMNHDFVSKLSHAMDSDGNISVYNGSKIIEAGEEIHLNYGQFPNEKLLLVYGFCVPNNPYDAVEIYAPISPADRLFDVKARVLLSRCGIQDVNAPHVLVQTGSTSVLPPGLLAVLRVTGVQFPEEIMAIASQQDPGIGMISLENEAFALQALYEALHAMTRQLALNMISDDNLKAASNPVSVLAGQTNDVPDSRGNRPTPKQAQAAAAAEERQKDLNIQNAKILCQSEYSILQVALAEISERMSVLQEATVQGYQ